MRLANTIALVLALAVSGSGIRAQTALAGEEPALPHAFVEQIGGDSNLGSDVSLIFARVDASHPT